MVALNSKELAEVTPPGNRRIVRHGSDIMCAQ